MKKVFLDTNILLDWVLKREQEQYAGIILELGRQGRIVLYASFLTYANMAYILRKMPLDERYGILRGLAKMMHILPMDEQQFHNALNLKVADFEDLLQYQCCIDGGCEVLVTNNTKHFASFCQIPLLTSEDFLLSI